MPPLTYSQLVVIRVSHNDPDLTQQAVTVLRRELHAALAEWGKEIPDSLRPTVELLNLGSMEDFPFKEIPRC